MKTYKILALVASAVVLTVNFALADNVSLKNNNNELVGSASDMSLLPTLHDGYTIVVNNSYNVGSGDDNYLELKRKSISITADNPVTITGNDNTLFLYSNAISSAKDITFDLNNIEFTNGHAGNGGFARFDVDRFAITATNVTLSNNSADVQGGAFYFSNSAVFKGNDSSLTFNGNQVGSNENKTPNDIFSSGSVTFTETGVYNLNGGVIANGSLSLTEGVNIAFNDNAVNKVENLVISGPETKAKFAQGVSTTVDGATTIQKTGTTTVDDKTVDNIEFEGNQTFNTVVVSNGGNVTFGGTNTSTGTVTITGSDTKAHFDGAQQLSTVKVTNKAEADITPINKFTQSGIYVDVFGKLEINGDFNVDGQSTKVEVGKNGVVDLLWADQEEIFNSDLIINGGGSVNLSNTTGNLNVTGTIDGEASGALNLAIMKSAMTADSETNLYGVTGNTLTVKALGDGNDYIDLRASDFAYHDESQMFELINLTNGQLTLGEFLQAVQLPFSWFGSVSDSDFTYIDQNLSATGSKFYIFKIDGDKIPEPSTWALMLLGVAGLYFVRRKNSAK